MVMLTVVHSGKDSQIKLQNKHLLVLWKMIDFAYAKPGDWEGEWKQEALLFIMYLFMITEEQRN